MKGIIFKVAVLAVIVVTGFITVFNIPDTVESFLPTVTTTQLNQTEYLQTVSGSGVILRNDLTESGEPEWLVSVLISEGDIRQVEVGQSADISGAAFDDGIYTATVRHIDSDAMPTYGDFLDRVRETMVEVTLVINNPDTVVISGNSGTSGESGGILRNGYTARADIHTAQTRSIGIAPYSSVMQDEHGEYVYVLVGNKAVRRDILTGIELTDGVEVVSGLSGKDRIIVMPHDIDEDMLVKSEAAS